MQSSVPIYKNLSDQVFKLERRDGRYRFDLETDLHWSQINATGDFFPESWLTDLGIRAEILRTYPHAWRLFQWAMALTAAEGMCLLEKGVQDFLHRFVHPEHPSVSSHMLDEDETKHTEMFRRFIRHLRESQPQWTSVFDEAFIDTAGLHQDWVSRVAQTGKNPLPLNQVHYLLWATISFVENLSMYIAERIEREPEGLHPLWRQMHVLHRAEELQHVRTAVAHVHALGLDPVTRLYLSKLLHFHLGGYFKHYFFLEVATRMVTQLCPEVPPFVRELPLNQTPMYLDVLSARAFRSSRAVIPALAQLCPTPRRQVEVSP